jgi:hypothetical protein
MTSPGATRSSSSTYGARAEPQQFAAIHGLPRYRTVRRQRQPVRLLRNMRLAQEGNPYKCRLGTPGATPSEKVVAQICPRWNRTSDWLKGLYEFRIAA